MFKKIPRQLLPPSKKRLTNFSARRLNNIMKSSDVNYLEIGLSDGSTFEQVRYAIKHGIDPNPRFNVNLLPLNVQIFKMYSDDFFDKHATNYFYDVIFIDGSHEYTQVGRDLINSLKHLKNGGRILMDDMVPSDSISAMPDMKSSIEKRKQLGLPGRPNHGDCYKLFPFILEHLNFLQIYLILYPDNPQLLLVAPDNFQSTINIDAISEALASFNFSNYAFENIFSTYNLKTYPIHVEEILMNTLNPNKKYINEM